MPEIRRMTGISRREVLAAGAALVLCPGAASADEGFRHAFSPLGQIKYPADFHAFDYVTADAPKGGTMRLARGGAFDTANTLIYPGRPPTDIRLIYDRLCVASDDERASYYGVLAQGIAVSDDVRRIVFELHPDARWHDGRPVHARDIVFTFETLKARGAPFYRQAFRSLQAFVERDNRVVFVTERTGDRDVIRRIASIPIHPEHIWATEPETGAGFVPIGSGPYRVASIDAPRRLVLERVADYWGRDLPVNRGRWNADRLTFDYYRDATVALEAFRADDYDVRTEDDPTRWRNGYAGPALTAGAIRRDEVNGRGVGDVHGLVFNLRRPFLADRRVRLALALMYDFEAVNRTIFANAHLQLLSVFGETELAARGAAGPGETALLGGLIGLPDGTLATPEPLAGLPQPASREARAVATRLLEDAGYSYASGRLADPASGRPIELRLVSPDPAYDRVLGAIERVWDRIGVRLVRIQGDPASAARQILDRDFDLATLSWSPAELPGTAERLLWHSALAEQPGSYALSGIQNAALDAAIEALETARSEAALRAAGRAFDRAFRQLMPMLPLWRSNTIRIAWWDRFGRPKEEKSGFPPSPIDRWWVA